jgi:protein-L-isoaspartate O-methyltransferase
MRATEPGSIWSSSGLVRGVALLAFCALAAVAQTEKGEAERLAPYYPTPEIIVEKMLQMGGLKAGEKIFDLGSGDGRIVILAARKFQAQATGIELDGDLASQSADRIKSLGLQKTARIIRGDILKQDMSSADLVTVYLLPTAMAKVRPLLEKQLKRGARVVAHDFEISDWTPERIEQIDDDGEGRAHTIYLYRR